MIFLFFFLIHEKTCKKSDYDKFWENLSFSWKTFLSKYLPEGITLVKLEKGGNTMVSCHPFVIKIYLIFQQNHVNFSLGFKSSVTGVRRIDFGGFDPSRRKLFVLRQLKKM